jgi:hypothetical protein
MNLGKPSCAPVAAGTTVEFVGSLSSHESKALKHGHFRVRTSSPSFVKDWKKSAARGGARTTLTLAKAHYPEHNLDLVTSGVPETYDDGAPVDEAAIRQSVLGYGQLCASGTQLDVYYAAYALPDSPSNASATISEAAEAGDGGDRATSATTQS